MLEGSLIILNPNRPHCCSFPQGQRPHWGTHPPACESEHVWPRTHAVKPLWGAHHNPKIGLQKKRPLRWSESGVPCGCMRVAANRLYKAFLLGWQMYAS